MGLSNANSSEAWIGGKLQWRPETRQGADIWKMTYPEQFQSVGFIWCMFFFEAPRIYLATFVSASANGSHQEQIQSSVHQSQ